MTPERRELTLVRELLEASVAPEVVSAVMFDALDRHEGALPASPAALGAFVEGPLRTALQARLGGAAASIVEQLTVELARVLPAAPPVDRRWDRVTTRELRVDGRPVRVLVVASRHALADRLMASLGEHRVSPVTLDTAAALDAQARMGLHAMVLVDAANFPALEPAWLASRLSTMDPTVIRAVWGGDLPYGVALLRAMAEQRVPAHPIDRREGIDPLLDLIRSRQERPGSR